MLPKRFANREVLVAFRRCSQFYPVSAGECDALGLPIGETIRCQCHFSRLVEVDGKLAYTDDNYLPYGAGLANPYDEAEWRLYADGSLALQLLKGAELADQEDILPYEEYLAVGAKTLFGVEQVYERVYEEDCEEEDCSERVRSVAHTGLRALKIVDQALLPAPPPSLEELNSNTPAEQGAAVERTAAQPSGNSGMPQSQAPEPSSVVRLSARDEAAVLATAEHPPAPNEAALQAARRFTERHG